MFWSLVVSAPAGVSKAMEPSARATSATREAEAGELGLVDVDAEDLLAVAIDLHVGNARHRRQRVERSGPRPGSSGPRPTCVSEVTASRITASALASALTMRGASASSGSWLVMRRTASRMSEAATLRSTPSLNSTVTRLRPIGRGRGDRLDAGDARHGALDHVGHFAVDRFGRGAAIVGGDGDDRPVDVGQFAHLDAETARPGRRRRSAR